MKCDCRELYASVQASGSLGLSILGWQSLRIRATAAAVDDKKRSIREGGRGITESASPSPNSSQRSPRDAHDEAVQQMTSDLEEEIVKAQRLIPRRESHDSSSSGSPPPDEWSPSRDELLSELAGDSDSEENFSTYFNNSPNVTNQGHKAADARVGTLERRHSQQRQSVTSQGSMQAFIEQHNQAQRQAVTEVVPDPQPHDLLLSDLDAVRSEMHEQEQREQHHEAVARQLVGDIRKTSLSLDDDSPRQFTVASHTPSSRRSVSSEPEEGYDTLVDTNRLLQRQVAVLQRELRESEETCNEMANRNAQMRDELQKKLWQEPEFAISADSRSKLHDEHAAALANMLDDSDDNKSMRSTSTAPRKGNSKPCDNGVQTDPVKKCGMAEDMCTVS